MVQVESSTDMESWVKVFNDLLQSVKPTLQQKDKVSDIGGEGWAWAEVLI